VGFRSRRRRIGIETVRAFFAHGYFRRGFSRMLRHVTDLIVAVFVHCAKVDEGVRLKFRA